MDAAALLSAIVESSDDAIVGKGLDGIVLSWNPAAERIFGYTADEMIGQSIRRLIPPDRQDEEDRILASVRRGERMPNFETLRLRKDGKQIPIAVTVSPVRDVAGKIVAASKIARDISAQVTIRERLQESEQRFRLLADNISQLAWIAGPDGGLTWYNQRWYDYTGTTFAQMEGWGWDKVQHPDHLARVVAHWREGLASGEQWEDTFPLRSAAGEYRWFLSRALPIRGDCDEIECWFGTNTDITDQRQAERQIELLLMEVNHRSKNLLAVIQSLARRTVAQGGDFVDRFEARIAGLSANQDLLVRRSWSSVPVSEMVEAQLEFLGAVRAQIETSGPDVSVNPAAAEAISMALHELATNALKYGALATRDGRVELEWAVEATPGCAEGRPQFAIGWRESGGPPVTAPRSTGFGSQIIADVPRTKLRGAVELAYDPAGFHWRLTCPAENALA
ncbi:MAG TPA: PAS domain S-box protein [Novosphingobium sp.]|nr:PAS domain S-box protein [Novosphingobium sp.]